MAMVKPARSCRSLQTASQSVFRKLSLGDFEFSIRLSLNVVAMARWSEPCSVVTVVFCCVPRVGVPRYGYSWLGGGKDKGKSSTVKLCVTSMYEDTVLS